MNNGRNADFPIKEYEQRWANAQNLMANQGLDGLLITEETNYIYFTGHRSQQNPVDKIRPYIFFLPREGRPVLIIMAFEVPFAELATYIDDIRTYPLFGHVDAIVNTVNDLGLEEAVIGAELGREQYLEISYLDYKELISKIPNATFQDAASLLLDIRLIKSPREIDYCRTAAKIIAKSLVECFSESRVGMTEHEVSTLARTSAMRNGAEFITFLAITSGKDLRKGKITVPTHRKLEVGDTVTIDMGVTVSGYCADVSRTAIVGDPSKKQIELYKMQRELSRKCFAAFRPGGTPHDVMQFCLNELDSIGWKLQPVGRIGHGVGLETTEYPSVALNEKIAVEEGMIFACNPNFVTQYGFFNCEENIVIIGDGFEILSSPEASPEPPVIAG